MAERREDSEYDLKYKKEDDDIKRAKMEQKREQIQTSNRERYEKRLIEKESRMYEFTDLT